MYRIVLPFLMLGLLLAPIFCWAAEPKTDQARAIAEIEKLGGKVTVDEKSPGKPVISVDLNACSVRDTGLHCLRADRLRKPDLSIGDITDDLLVQLEGLTQLQVLALGGNHITDAGLKPLRGLTQLRELHLQGTRTTDPD